MICTVYWAKGGLILVPDCMIASREAEHAHGPLQRCGSFDTDRLPPDLAELIDREFDDRSFTPMGTDLAMRLGYVAAQYLPLPPGFAWEEKDWWISHGELALLCGSDPPVLVAAIQPHQHDFGWHVITNCHKDWLFRGTRISGSRAAAMQFLVSWAEANADRLRCETSSTHGSRSLG